MTETILDNIINLKERCNSLLDEFGADLGLSSRESALLLSLEEYEEINSNSLSERMHLSASRISRIVDRLIQKGYLHRRPAEDDRRYIEISLTVKGMEAKKKIAEVKKICEDKIRSKINAGDIETVKKALNILLHSME